MSDALIGEIRPFAGTFAPYGWLECNGQSLTIQGNQLLFAVISGNFGYDSTTQTFKLPALNGSVLVNAGQSPTTGTYYPLGSQGAGGLTSVQVSYSQMGAHTHQMNGAVANQITTKLVTTPTNNCYMSNPAETSTTPVAVGKGYFPATSTGAISAALAIPSLTAAGGTAGTVVPHSNMQPSVAIKYCICATDGEFPPRP